MDCINLKKQFGRRYRIAYEESREAEFGEGARTVDPRLMFIPCQYGHIFPWGGDLLAASVDGHGRIARRVASMDCCTVVQDGDDGELTATFNADDFKQVASLMRPRRRKQLSEERHRKLVEAGQSTRFSGTNTEHSDERRDSRPQGVSEHPRHAKAEFNLHELSHRN
ncbi:MAG: hypothetical protein RIC55_21480 [Pirellulaceae bacterium]